MASTDGKPVPIKNAAYRVTFPILDNDGDLVTAAAGLDSEVSKDAGTFADCTNEATEIATSSGVYYLDLTADEMNADTVSIIVKTSTTDAKTTVLVLYPQESGDIPVDVESVSGDATAADNLEADYDGNGYNKSASTLGTVTTVTDWADGGRLDLLLDRLITELDTTRTEPGQGAPGVSEKIGVKIDYLYKAWRNKVTQTSSEYALYNDDTTTVDHKAAVSDDGTTATIGEVATGP